MGQREHGILYKMVRDSLMIRLQKRLEGNEGVSMQITGEEAFQQGKHQTEKSLAWDVLETTKAVAEEQFERGGIGRWTLDIRGV